MKIKNYKIFSITEVNESKKTSIIHVYRAKSEKLYKIELSNAEINNELLRRIK